MPKGNKFWEAVIVGAAINEGAEEKHPQQVLSCDSCGHAEKTNSKTYPVKCKASKPVPMMVHVYCIAWFGYVGCASHLAMKQMPSQEKDVQQNKDGGKE